MGQQWFGILLSRPWSDQSILVRSAGDNGSGQPCAMCHAQMAKRYFLTVLTATGSKWQVFHRSGLMALGSEVAQIVNE